MTESVQEASGSSASTEQRIMQERRDKLAALESRGVNPWPYTAKPTTHIDAIRAAHAELPAGESTNEQQTLCGRLMGKRGHGKAVFADLVDRTGRIQLLVTLDGVGETQLDDFKSLDIGDWIEVDGEIMCSRRGELTIAASKVSLLAKCLRPMPEKFHGLTDVETRLSRRYLDLAVNEETRELFVTRSKVVSAIRRFLEDRGYYEVETPILQPIYGGAAVRPFTTHHNELDADLYLRIAVELYLKRLIVGGMERVFEIGRNFRNEGVSFKHNPEFTMIELYQAYANYVDIMDLFEEMIKTVAQEVTGSTVIDVDGTQVDLGRTWKRQTLCDAILEKSGVDISIASEDEMRAALENAGHDSKLDKTRGKLIDALLTIFVEGDLIEPTFITDYPVELSPFARRKADDPDVTERFEFFMAGMEVANAFSELNDPADQYQRFVEQKQFADAGDDTAEQMDLDYIRALEYGMPPTGGLGMGIDRFVMLLTGQRSIREVILFPARRQGR